MKSNSKMQLCADMLIIEELSGFNKNAQGVSDLVSMVTNYVSAHIDPNNKTKSIIDLLAPGAMFLLLRGLNLGWLGTLLGIAANVFHISIEDILSSIFNKIKDGVLSEKPFSSSQIDSIVSGSVSENSQQPIPENGLDKRQFNKELKDAKLLKLAIKEYSLNKKAGLLDNKKGATTNLLAKVLGWFIKIILASAGLMVAGDAVSSLVGRPSALSGTYQAGKDQPAPVSSPIIQSTQSKFKINPSYSDVKYNNGNTPWSESVNNDPESIANMLIDFAKSVYSGLDGFEDMMQRTPGFNLIKNRIVLYNQSSQGDDLVFIPKYLHTKKEIADLFIDDVAKMKT